jgi:CheY-like chemotaxis protein
VRTVVIDDDPSVRSTIASLVEAQGGVVVGEAVNSLQGVDAIEAESPNLVVLDLALAHGTGLEVLDAATRMRCRIVVFSSFTDDLQSSTLPPGTLVVDKPDFLELERVLAACAEDVARPQNERSERRRLSPAAPERSDPSSIDDAYGFYEALAQAAPGDVLVTLHTPATPGWLDAGALAATVRNVVRTDDLVLSAEHHAQVMLMAGADEGADAVLARLRRVWAHTGSGGTIEAAFVVVAPGEEPGDAFERLKHEPRMTLTDDVPI